MRLNRIGKTAPPLLTAVVLLVGCSSGGSEAVSSQSIASLKKHLVTSADIARTAPNSPARAFLQYWANVQYRAWSAALSQYESALATTVGVVNIVEAMKTQSSYFETVKPVVEGTAHTGNEAIVRYQIPDAAGDLFATSMSFRRNGNRWLIHYDPQLDGMLQTAETARVQNAVDPNAPKPSKEAIKAGADAARLQSFYLQSQHQPKP
jgi:hypothetical protein